MKDRFVIWGASGHAKVLRDCLDKHRCRVIALFDNDINITSPFSDVPLYYKETEFEKWVESYLSSKISFMVAIGGARGRDRLNIQIYLKDKGLKPYTVFHKTSYVAQDCYIGEGSQVLANTTVCVEVKIGKACIVNTAATIDHECGLGDGVHICPGAHLAGCVSVGDFAMVGTGAVVLPRIKIGEGAVVGAGAVVTKDVLPYSKVVGNPARVL